MKKIIVALDMAGCPNRCKHCWLGHSPNGHMNKDDLYYVAKEFRKITNDFEIISWYREPDFMDNYRELFEIERKLSNNKKASHFELLSYWRAVRDNEYIPWLKKLGVSTCQLTLWGGKEITDYYTGRVGAYDEIIKTINILMDNEIAPRIQIFVNKKNVHDLKTIEETIISLNIPERCSKIGQYFSLFVHQGSCDGENIRNYCIWLTPEDIYTIPEMFVYYTLKHFNKNNIMDVFGFTEQKLYEKLLNDETCINYVSDNPVFYIDKNFNVFPNITNISPYWQLGNLKKDGVEKIIENYKNNNSIAQNISITKTVSELTKKSGIYKSQRLFGESDYKIYLLNKYCESIEKSKTCT
jgi:sulfatase maturation enzyme AslB (radical SAM superfamily)